MSGPDNPFIDWKEADTFGLSTDKSGDSKEAPALQPVDTLLWVTSATSLEDSMAALPAMRC